MASYNLHAIEGQILKGMPLTKEDEQRVIRKVGDYWDNHPDVVNRFPRWKKYIAWTAGYQKYDYNKITKKLVEVPVNRKRSIVFNRLKPFVRTLLAKLNADTPTVSVVPNTTDDEDIQAARVGDKVAEGLSAKMRFSVELSNLKAWVILCNRGYLRVAWNEEDVGILGYSDGKGEPEETDIVSLIDGQDQEPTPPLEAGEPITDPGDVRIESIPPFNCRCDPLYQDRRKWRWFMFGEEVDAEEIEEAYDLKPGSVTDPSTTLDSAYDLEMTDDYDLIVSNPDKNEDVTGRTCVYKEYWTPDVFIFVAGRTVLEYGKNKWGEIPFFDAEDRLVPIDNYAKGFSYNESPIKDAIAVQRDYNRTISNMSLALDRASKLKVMTPLGSLLNKKQWTNDFGVFVDFNPRQGTPHQMKMDPFPMDVPQYRSSLEREFENVLNVHPASVGQLPERASHASGTLVNLLLEQDDMVLNPLLNTINAAVQDAWRLALRMVQKNYTAERIIGFTGDDGTMSVGKFKGSDLRGNTDIRVVSQRGLPNSRALRVEYLMRLRSEGLLTDDKSTLELLEFGNADKIFKDSLLHERRAYKENGFIHRKEVQVPEDGSAEDVVKGWIYPLEDHNAHLVIHLRDRLGAKADTYDEEQLAWLDVHIETHKMALQALQIEQMKHTLKMQEMQMASQLEMEGLGQEALSEGQGADEAPPEG